MNHFFINNLDSPQTNGDWHYGYIQLDPDPQDESIPPPTFDGVSMVFLMVIIMFPCFHYGLSMVI